MNLIRIIRKLAINNCRTRREASKFLRTVYAPIERSNGRDPSRTKKTAIWIPIWKMALQYCHQMDRGGDTPVALSAVITV